MVKEKQQGGGKKGTSNIKCYVVEEGQWVPWYHHQGVTISEDSGGKVQFLAFEFRWYQYFGVIFWRFELYLDQGCTIQKILSER